MFPQTLIFETCTILDIYPINISMLFECNIFPVGGYDLKVPLFAEITTSLLGNRPLDTSFQFYAIYLLCSLDLAD